MIGSTQPPATSPLVFLAEIRLGRRDRPAPLPRLAARSILALLLGVAPLGGCGCPPGQTRMTGLELFFGGSIPEAAWSRFAAEVLTPAFPAGFTVFEASGQWRAPAGTILREHTRVVEIFASAPQAQLDRVTTAYRRRFNQVSVGVVSLSACAAF